MDMNALEPAIVFDYFKEISAIPRGSGNPDGISSYLCRFAEDHGLAYEHDEAGNVLIRKEASEGYEDHAPVLLQGHVDMVCVKTDDSDHDFENDPIRLLFDGEWLSADGTTLGGDDGIAVAYMLALLADDAIPHPPLETLFTTDEETGMYGAKALDPSWITAKRMINLDSEEEGVITTGCAGGVDIASFLPLKRHALRGIPVRILISGLRGGHSGAEIEKPYANANKLLARVLRFLYDSLPVSLVDLTGGEKRNAIATVAEAIILADEEDLDAIAEAASQFEEIFRNEYKVSDEGISVSCTCEEEMLVHAMDDTSAKRVLDFLTLVPHGVEKMSGAVEGAVETSTNFGVMGSEEEVFNGYSLTRSGVGSAKEMMADRIVCLTELLGGEAEVSGDYPAWEFKTSSELLKTAERVYEALCGKKPVVTITHGGLECGLIADALPEMEIVSVGPQMEAIHTFNERLHVPSCGRVWELLKAILKEL